MSDQSIPYSKDNRPTGKDMLGWIARGDVGLAFGVIGVIVLLILPIPAFMLDLLLSLAITSSVLILMTSLMIKKPLEFTAFPTVLLVTTLFRLALNVASTRLILGQPTKSAESREAYALLSSRCARCNRTLTVPASIHRGLGPECAQKMDA